MFVNNDSAENGCGAEVAVVGTAGGGKGAVNSCDDPNGAVDVGGVGRPNEPGTTLVEGDDEDALDSGGHDGGATRLGAFGYARLETGYVAVDDEAIDCPGDALYGASNEAVAVADGGITEEPGVDAVDFVDKLLTLLE